MPEAMGARELVLEALLLITRDGEFSHKVLNQMLSKYQYMDKKERAFITRVVNGTLDHMLEIDYIINQFSKVKVNKMKPVIRTILRSAVYQLKYMDSVPDSAVCNEAVKLAAKKNFINLKGFVNGVLRNISRNMDQIEYPNEDVQRLSIIYSMPAWILKGWLKDYDRQTVETMAAEFLKEKPVSVRFDPDKITKESLCKLLAEEGVTAAAIDGISCGLWLSNYDYLGALESFRRGYYQVQDISSMRVAQWAAPNPGDYVIDVCAAPGGKAIHMAELLHGTGHVEARDLSEYKIELIRENIDRSGLSNIEAVVRDATIIAECSFEKADIVIADLPCSGLGVLGKKPDLKYRMTPEMQEELVGLQRQILTAASTYVKPGGKLVYSTCTINRAENEENAQWFQIQCPDYSLVKEQQMLPGADGGDGFFIAVFQKEKHE